MELFFFLFRRRKIVFRLKHKYLNTHLQNFHSGKNYFRLKIAHRFDCVKMCCSVDVLFVQTMNSNGLIACCSMTMCNAVCVVFVVVAALIVVSKCQNEMRNEICLHHTSLFLSVRNVTKDCTIQNNI